MLVLREETESPEAVEVGASKLVGTDVDVILAEAQKLLDDETVYRSMAQGASPYGDGHAAERIVNILLDYFSSKESMMVTKKLLHFSESMEMI